MSAYNYKVIVYILLISSCNCSVIFTVISDNSEDVLSKKYLYTKSISAWSRFLPTYKALQLKGNNMKETPTALGALQDFNNSVQKCLKPTGICSKFLPKTFQILISRRVGPCQGLSDALRKAVSDMNDFQLIAKLTV